MKPSTIAAYSIAGSLLAVQLSSPGILPGVIPAAFEEKVLEHHAYRSSTPGHIDVYATKQWTRFGEPIGEPKTTFVEQRPMYNSTQQKRADPLDEFIPLFVAPGILNPPK